MLNMSLYICNKQIMNNDNQLRKTYSLIHNISAGSGESQYTNVEQTL